MSMRLAKYAADNVGCLCCGTNKPRTILTTAWPPTLLMSYLEPHFDAFRKAPLFLRLSSGLLIRSVPWSQHKSSLSCW